MGFDKAYEVTMKDEGLGVWTNDPDDPGDETYSGISRVHNKDWVGWVTVDKAKLEKSFPENIRNNRILLEMVKSHFKRTRWIEPGLDKVNEVFPALADKMFNTITLYGEGRAIEWLQRTVNLLNRNQKEYFDIAIDKSIGTKTLGALKSALRCNPNSRVMALYRAYTNKCIIEKMEANPAKEKYIGWLDRAEKL